MTRSFEVLVPPDPNGRAKALLDWREVVLQYVADVLDCEDDDEVRTKLVGIDLQGTALLHRLEQIERETAEPNPCPPRLTEVSRW